ncbi:SCO6745 family protein [Actinomadura decatromicini]|uniref:SalK n=1 Tax=Actinomadura decatromicini TaxID=2604572 RepID=A0A5D3F631_9ACTN|nr:hypothetical protein [Actinomadura decatromicini]TYK43246.1 hypothetical protein FXF68_39205 [Actinomadura decatromicini]
MDASVARDFWMVLEPIHAVTYFSPECLDGSKEIGLKGFWMGYFGSRGAPLGPVPAGVIEASFFGFHPSRVRRAIPDAWSFASPDDILRTRSATAAKALRRVAPGIEAVAPEAIPPLRTVADTADAAGRVLFAANRDLALPEDPVEALWQLATTLREHRGDGHIAALTSAGLNGLEANVLASAMDLVPTDRIRDSRGWSAEEWANGIAALKTRGLLDENGITQKGRTLRTEIENRTNALAAPPYLTLDAPETVLELLKPFARALAETGEIPFPNPIGVPRPT